MRILQIILACLRHRIYLLHAVKYNLCISAASSFCFPQGSSISLKAHRVASVGLRVPKRENRNNRRHVPMIVHISANLDFLHRFACPDNSTILHDPDGVLSQKRGLRSIPVIFHVLCWRENAAP